MHNTDPPTPDPPPDEMLTTKQVAAILGITTPSVTRMAAKGRLKPARKFPTRTGGYLFIAADVLKVRDKRKAVTP